MLVRTVECLEGHVEIELVCEPVFDYGRTPAEWTLVDGDRHAADATGAGVTIRLHTDLALGIEGNRVRARHVLEAGERRYCALSWAEELAGPADVDDAERPARRHHALLAHLARPGAHPRPPLARPDPALGAAIKGLTYMPTGATVAALTTSLPETPGGERNWDYRYTWMRDTTFTLQALHFLNLDWEADEFMQFVADLEPNDDGGAADHVRHRRPARPDRVDPRRPLRLRRAPARCGSATAPSTSARTTSSAPCSTRSCCTPSAASGCRGGCGRSSRRRPSARSAVWREPDQGIWEARGEPQHYVSSKLMCWVALDRAAKLAEIRGDRDRRPTWRATADEIRADILEHGVNERGVLRQHYETDALDASTLLAAIFGFLPPDDERLRATVLAIADELTEDGFVLRYRTDETDDGLSGKEGTFLICSFWLVSALAIVGEHAAGARPDGAAAARRLAARPLRRGVRRRHRPPPRQLPAGVLAPRADRGRGAHHHPRAGGGDLLMDHYDVIIVGTGAGGGTLAAHLAPSGKRILLLERGDWLPREPQNWARRSVFVDNRYVSPDTWYDGDGKPFQPQVHYFVGGATKLYGAALYRLRAEDFGELRHHDGVSPAWPISYDELEPYYTQAEQLYQVHGARGEDPTEPPRSGPYPFPAVSHEPRIQQLSDDLEAAGYHPFHAPCGIMLDEAQHALQRVRALRELRRLPVPGAREVRRRGARRAAGARAPERHAADEREGGQARDERGGHGGDRGRRRARDGRASASPPTSSCVACGAANTAKLLLRSASDRHPNGLANGSDQVGRNYMFHDSQAVLALSREENPTVFQKTLGLNDFYFAATSSTTRSATSRWSASRRRRCSAARSRARRSSRPSGRSSESPATRSTSGSRPRTCRAPRTASRSTATARSRSLHADQQRPEAAAVRQAAVDARPARHARAPPASTASRT